MAYCTDCNGEVAVLIEDCPRHKRIMGLKAIITCNQSDGYLQQWARKELEKMGVKVD